MGSDARMSSSNLGCATYNLMLLDKASHLLGLGFPLCQRDNRDGINLTGWL